MNWNKLFTEIHSIGANRFGFKWVSANEAAICALTENCGVGELSKKESAMISSVVLAVMNYIENCDN